MVYAAELLDIKKDIGNGFPVCLLKLGEMEVNCLLGRYSIEQSRLIQEIKNFPVGGKYKFDIWIDAADELEIINKKTMKMPIPENDYLFDYFTGVVVERIGFTELGIPEVRVETENNFLFDVTGIHGWEDLRQIKPGDYVEISNGIYFIKDIYPLDYEE